MYFTLLLYGCFVQLMCHISTWYHSSAYSKQFIVVFCWLRNIYLTPYTWLLSRASKSRSFRFQFLKVFKKPKIHNFIDFFQHFISRLEHKRVQQTNRWKQLIPAAWERPTNKNTERTKSKYNAGLRINRTEQLCIKITMAYSTLPWNTNYINYQLISHSLSHSNRIKLQQHWRSQVYLGAFKSRYQKHKYFLSTTDAMFR